MTDPNEEPSPEAEPLPIVEVFEQLTAAEKAVSFGALLLLVTWLIGDLLGGYSIDDVTLPLSVGVIGGVWSYSKGARAPWHSLYPWLVAIAALAIAILGFNTFFQDFSRTQYEGIDGLWRVLYYVSAGLLGWGGASMLRTR